LEEDRLSGGSHQHGQVLRISMDGRYVVSGGGNNDYTLRVWDTGTWKEVTTIKGHKADVTACGMTNNGKILVSASMDQTVRTWDVSSQKEVDSSHHPNTIFCGALSSDSSFVVVGTYDGSLKILNTDGLIALPPLKGHSGAGMGRVVNGVAISTDCKWIVSASSDCTAKIYTRP